MRTEVFYKTPDIDGRAKHLLSRLKSQHGYIDYLAIVDVYITEGVPGLAPELACSIFTDSVSQKAFVVDSSLESLSDNILPGWNFLIETAYKPGVTDPVAITIRDTLEIVLGDKIPENSIIQTARQYLFVVRNPKFANPARLANALHNRLIQQAIIITREEWERGKSPPLSYPHRVPPSPAEVKEFNLNEMNDEELIGLSKKRLLSLNLEEMRAIRSYYLNPKITEDRLNHGLPPGATDAELEMIAQTWSEHCKHKIFQAEIEYTEGKKTETIDSLFNTFIKGTTEKLWSEKKYLKSVFTDNSGVIQFDPEHLICFKVETHNSPSALDPYGGAITGIVGVNRDIMGTGKSARPIFNTNVLCFGYPYVSENAVPEGFFHPRQVMEGVHRGIVDGGNQSGIPTVAGAFLFDNSYMGKPLVFCGTGGILPASIGGEEAWINHVYPGDKAVMVGGRIGKDGIHGATFSSLAMDETSPISAVQIGDPFTQKKVSDFLIEARDRMLFNGITDNGAGGLSSSLGEMAQKSGGVRIFLHRCPLKYQGLAPWEILLSESQERMSLAVSPLKLEEFLNLAKRWDVEATVVGEFTDSGYAEAYYRRKQVLRIELSFLHHGLPRMKLKARWEAPEITFEESEIETDLKTTLVDILSELNVASKESFVRQYDHEVQATSIIKPFIGIRGDCPSDGAVLKPVYNSLRGITITHGICPRYGNTDTYRMVRCAVDEAYRSHIAMGGDPDLVSALDNFCWPDPVESESNPDGRYKLAQLVRACRGLQEICLAYRIPLISGKDSMKNDAYIGGKKLSVRPTVLISLLGIIPDIGKAVSTDFKNPGDLIYLAGETRGELGGTILEKIKGKKLGLSPDVRPDEAVPVYKAIHGCMQMGLVASCHDLSDGGLAVSVAESSLGGKLGADISLDMIPGADPSTESSRLLFCETPSRLLLTVAPENEGAFKSKTEGLPIEKIGEVKSDRKLSFSRDGKNILELTVEEVEKAWKNSF
ncbi:MAG: phosphoribosylformylglycinamidine synthase [Spirochaetes bacterium]|nr:MAG: phosphoribosylformylglycinamidine synthase [Spirochaetota bacterium]